jgi:hypothetical protein
MSGLPRWPSPETVITPSWNHVNVKVEDGLIRMWPRGVEDIHTRGAQRAAQAIGYAAHGGDDGLEVSLGGIEEIDDMALGHHEHVPLGKATSGQRIEREHSRIFIDNRRGRGSVDNPTEDAVEEVHRAECYAISTRGQGYRQARLVENAFFIHRL